MPAIAWPSADGDDMGEIGTARILAHSWAVIRANSGLFWGTVGLLTAVSAVLDLSDPDGSRSVIVDGLASLVAQYLVTRRLIEDRWPSGSHAGALPVIAVLIVSSLAILLGMVLLIVPGIILAVRWFPVVPMLVARNEGVADALRQSWEKTRGSGIAIFAALAALYAPTFAAIPVALVLGDAVWSNPASSIALNLLASLGLISAWFAAVAYCELSGTREESLENVFA